MARLSSSEKIVKWEEQILQEEAKRDDCIRKIEELKKKIREEQLSQTKKFTNKVASLLFDNGITDELEQQLLLEKITQEIETMSAPSNQGVANGVAQSGGTAEANTSL